MTVGKLTSGHGGSNKAMAPASNDVEKTNVKQQHTTTSKLAESGHVQIVIS
jgi:hypothetical protein